MNFIARSFAVVAALTTAPVAHAASTAFRTIGVPEVTKKTLASLFAFALIAAAPAQATVVVLNYSGAIEYSASYGGPTNAVYAIGTPFSGTLTYDTGAIPSYNDGTTATYYGSFGSLSLTIGSFSAIEDSYLNGFIRHTPLTEILAYGDVLSISTPNPFINGHNFPVQWGLDYNDMTRTAMSSPLLPAQYPNSPPGFVRFYIGDNNGFSTGFANLTAAAVPEPATWAIMILGFGAIGAAIRSKRRQKPSLAPA